MAQITLHILLAISLAHAQLNGEFWWMNSKLNNLKNVSPTPPKIDTSDFQNDESSRIIFRDDDLFTNKLKPIRDRTAKLMPNNAEENKVRWPEEEHMKTHDVEIFASESAIQKKEEHMKNHDVDVFAIENVNAKPDITKPGKIRNKFEDVLIFSYPKNEKFVTSELNKLDPISSSVHPTQSTVQVTDTSSSGISFSEYKLPTLPTTINKVGESQNICTYTTKKKCNQFKGFVYEYARRIPASKSKEPLVCCILPIDPKNTNEELSESDIIYFPQQSSNRFKRSDTETNISLKQRDYLLKQRFSSQRQNIKPASTPLSKVVTPSEEDYEDPYSNIRNIEVQSKPKGGNTKYSDYIESHEYVDELPKPGLVGLYSDHGFYPTNRPYANGNNGFSYGGSDDDYVPDENDDDDDDDEEDFGYSTIDPRKGAKKKKIPRPIKLTTPSDDNIAYDAERHTISFQSNPDFHVFQGFKLLNLFRNTSRVFNKQTYRDKDLSVLVGSPENEEVEEVFDEKQLFDGCGNVAVKRINERGNQGEAASGTQPWLALVVLTNRQHNVLCYATLVHPRAAITVGDCTQGTAPGDVTVLAGLWDLNDKTKVKSRVATVHVHPKYRPGEVENNLALLHWMQPLQLSRTIQPACLGEPQAGNQCRLYGWGGLSQGIRQPRPRWQRATVRACTGSKRTQDSFCVTTPRGTVTGLGGPLICEVAGHSSIAGVVVSRDNGYVLSPVRDWTMKMDNLVNGD